MKDSDFQKLVEEAINSLPLEFSEKLENVAVVTQDYPTKHQIETLQSRGEAGLLLGLYQGIPQTRRGNYGIGGPLPDKITVFKIPLLMISGSDKEVKENVQKTVKHEIAHHFGMTDEEIRKKNH